MKFEKKNVEYSNLNFRVPKKYRDFLKNMADYNKRSLRYFAEQAIIEYCEKIGFEEETEG